MDSHKMCCVFISLWVSFGNQLTKILYAKGTVAPLLPRWFLDIGTSVNSSVRY